MKSVRVFTVIFGLWLVAMVVNICTRPDLDTVSFYRLQYEYVRDSLEVTRRMYRAHVIQKDLELKGHEAAIDSLQKRLDKLSVEREDDKDKIDDMTDNEIVDEFNWHTYIEDPKDTDSVKVSTGQLRLAVELFSDRSYLIRENETLREMKERYEKTVWTYKDIVDIMQKENASYQKSLDNSLVYIENLEKHIEQQELYINRLNSRNRRLLTGGAIVVGTAIIINLVTN